MSYGQISAALAIARGTVQGHAEHSRRAGLVPGLILAFRDKDGDWYPDRPEAILPGGPYATGDSIKIRGDRPSRFAGQELVCAYEDTPSGRIPDDSPGYAYHPITGRPQGRMRVRACAGGSGCKASQDQCRYSPAGPVPGSLMASGWGSPVRAARAVATSGRPART